MCCLFGVYNYSKKGVSCLEKLVNSLAREATIRGTDATGIAYNNKENLIIHKEPKDAYSITFKPPAKTISVMGHTRHTTQGNEKNNFNNHPFMGKCENLMFAFAHNGIIMNDISLKHEMKLPDTKIETDSYVAVQLLESQKILDSDSIKFMAEKVKGSFSFTLLDSKNNMWFVKGDSPLSIVHFPKLKLYVYASTDEILYKGIVSTDIFNEVKNGDFEEINITDGDILKFSPDGAVHKSAFEYKPDYYDDCCWWRYGKSIFLESKYVDDLKSVAKGYGYEPETIDELIDSGFSPDEIEDFIYCWG